MTRSYPEKNPFPHQGTMTVEGARDSDVDESYQQPRTLRLEPVRKTLRLVKEYLERFDSTERRQGQFAVLKGDHGSGKTHTIKFVMDWTRQRDSRGDGQDGRGGKGVGKTLQLYAKAEGPDFLTVYRQLMAQVTIEELQDLNLRFLGVVASEQLGRTSKDAGAKATVADKLRDDPKGIYKLFNTYLVEEGAVQEKQRVEVKKLSGGGDDFRRAFSYLLSPELTRAAYNWLSCAPISDDDLRSLGVSGQIASPKTAKVALQLLATLFNRIGRALIVYIDQYEKLIINDDKVLAAENTGLLHTLVEAIPRDNGMFLLSGNEEAWSMLPRDLKSRFAGNVVNCPVLRPNEASEMIRLYLAPASEEFMEASRDTSITELSGDFYPFDTTTVRKIISYSAGNIRRLLQICSASFEEAFPSRQPITEEIVETALQRGNLPYYSRDSVRDEIEGMLINRSHRFRREYSIGGVRVDLAVVDAGEAPLLLVEISEATFHEHEAQLALDNLNRVQKIRQQGVQAPVVFIALGYVSPEVTKSVREFSQELIIYKPSTFRDEFERILGRIGSAAPRPANTRREIEMLEKRLAELQAKLEHVLGERKSESDVIDKRLAEFFQRQSEDRLEERRQAARPAWAEERRRIEKEIHEARQHRRTRELEELERLRARAGSDQLRRAWLQATMVFLVGLGTFMYFVLELDASDFSSSLTTTASRLFTRTPLGLVVVAGLAIAILIILRARNLIGPPLYRELAAPVSSIEELERLAQQYAGIWGERLSGDILMRLIGSYISLLVSFVSPFPPNLRKLLRDPNPHYRYAGVVAADPELWERDLMSALKAERSAAVRSAIAKRLGKVVNPVKTLDDMFPKFLPELAYMVESGYRSSRAEKLHGARWPKPLDVLATIYGDYYQYPRSFAVMMAGQEVKKNDQSELLRKAFETGLDRFNSSELALIPEGRVREAANELSPFDAGGLGTFDELHVIDQIDQYYIFFRQLQFFIDHDLLAPPRETGALNS